MKRFLILFLVITCGYKISSEDVRHQPIPGSMKFILYNDTTAVELFIHKDGIIWDPSQLKIDADEGVLVDPVTESVMWNEGGVLTKGYLTNKSTSKLWAPEILGQILHYDWHRKFLFWYSQENQQRKKLKVLDLIAGETYVVNTIESELLEAIDPKNNLLIYKSDDSLKMYTMDDLEEKYSISINSDFKLMDIIPASNSLLVLQSSHKNNKNESKRFIKVYNYEGEELYSLPVNEKYEAVYFQEPLLVMKHESDITVMDMKSKNIIYKIQRSELENMKLKRLQDVNELPVQKTLPSVSNCKETDYQEVCVLDESSNDEDDHCIHQSYIISNGTSFKHYNPASKHQPIPLPFKVTGSIRSFAMYRRERIFWIDSQTNSIMVNVMYVDTKPEKLNFPTFYPTDVQVDEMQKYVFWSDGVKGTIEMSDFDGHSHKVLFSGVSRPQKILLALEYGSILWTEGESNDTLVIGSIETGSRKVLFQSKQPIFGFTINYIYNILYVGSQSDEQLLIHALNFDLGLHRQVFNSKLATRFSGILYSRNKLYLWGLGGLWMFQSENQMLNPISGANFNSLFVSPIKCNDQLRDKACGMCAGLCMPEAQGVPSALSTARHKNCISLDLTTEGIAACASMNYMFASTQKSIYRWSANRKCYHQVYSNQQNSITGKQPVAYDSMSNKIYIVKNGDLYYSDLQKNSWSQLTRSQYDIEEVVYTGQEKGTIIKRHSLYYDNWVSKDEHSLYISLPDTAESMIAYPAQKMIFYIDKSYIYCHSTESSRRKHVISIPTYVHTIRISYDENRIYYWNVATLVSMRLDGRKLRESEFDVPSIRTFTFLNKMMYFVSEHDDSLYELDYLAKDYTPEIKLVQQQLKGIFNLFNFPPVNDKANGGCEQLKDDDGKCFHITFDE